MSTFGARLRASMDQHGPLCAGIDPHPGLLVDWGFADDAAGLERFAMTAVEAFAGHVAAVKPQSAFFERHGSAGIAVLERAVAAARSAGTPVVLDVKRGDMRTSAQAYADAYLDPASPLACDAITASPYQGFGVLEPIIDTALKHGNGVFVLALTSNPEAPEVQHARLADGSGTVAGAVLRQIAERNAGERPMGSIGAVVGATIGQTDETVAVNGPLLVPGLGAQGGTPDDVRRIFAGVYHLVLGSSSRRLLSSGPDIGSLRAAAHSSAGELVDALS